MNDLSGLNWDSKPSSQPRSNLTASQQQASRFTPSPSSSRGTTPAPSQQAAKNGFANLLNPTQISKASGSMSMQEKQRQLMEERAKQQASQKQAHDSQFAANDASFWEGLGSGRGNTPLSSSPQPPPVINDENEDDILAAFNSSAPVDKSSHFPPPAPEHTSRDPSRQPSSFDSRGTSPMPLPNPSNTQFDEDDDPFGLGQMEKKPPQPVTNGRPHAREPSAADDDILGLLGKPVEESRRRPDESPPRRHRRGEEDDEEPSGRPEKSGHPQDKAIAELVDMGFPADKARDALVQTDTGTNVQAAVGLLLNQAHEEARSRSKNQQGRSETPDQQSRGRASAKQGSTRGEDGGSMPAWMRKGADEAGGERQSPAPSREADVAQYAQNLGNSFLKSANSLWKTGQKKVQKAYAEFQQEGTTDPSKPRWMQEGGAQEDRQRPQKSAADRATEEAMMLEMQGPPQERRRPAPERQRPQARQSSPDRPTLPTRPRPDSNSPAPSRPREKLSRQAVEEQSAQAYVSSARRRKPAAQPTPPPAQDEETLDIFSSTPAPAPKPSNPAPHSRPSRTQTPSSVPPPRKAAPPRNVPSVSPSALSNSSNHRQNGGAAFKRGDYAEAREHYTSALSGIPDAHPLIIVILCNRALTNIKTGDPKAAITDADKALTTIGPSRGDGESISLGSSEGEKPMKEFYGKALARKAEALEALEKWTDAASVWKQAVEAGVGGPVAIQGKTRCEKAANPKSPVQAIKKPVPQKPKASATLSALNGSSDENEAVRRLRAQNAAAAAASDEAFALTDAVEARLVAWKGTKSDNLRALLASLDTVLWPSAGWQKIGMGDLVMPNKVKINYMKAIAKVHPDKIPQDASTEQKMISGAVFATLNEAWDKFKKDNGL